jgi:hypothetical protein
MVNYKKVAELIDSDLGKKNFLLKMDKLNKLSTSKDSETIQDGDINFNITLKTNLREGGNYLFDIYDEYDVDVKKKKKKIHFAFIKKILFNKKIMANRRGTSLKSGTYIESRPSLPRTSDVNMIRQSKISLLPIQETIQDPPQHFKKQIFSPSNK